MYAASETKKCGHILCFRPSTQDFEIRWVFEKIPRFLSQEYVCCDPSFEPSPREKVLMRGNNLPHKALIRTDLMRLLNAGYNRCLIKTVLMRGS